MATGNKDWDIRVISFTNFALNAAIDSFTLDAAHDQSGFFIDMISEDTTVSLGVINNDTSNVTKTSTLVLDLGNKQKVHSTILSFRWTTPNGGGEVTVTFEHSDDKSTWTQISSDTEDAANADSSFTSSIEDTAYRYLRIKMSTKSSAINNEIQLKNLLLVI